jgi:iron complex outermembrane receptor protein
MKSTTSKIQLRNWLMAGTAAMTLAMAPAFAQTAEPEEEPAAEETEGSTRTDREARQQTIVVTGSLLRRDEFTSAAPITVITAEVATLEGLIDTAEILQGSSVAAGSGQLNNQFQGFVVEGGTGINSISLRGLGAQRSLVLLNGRRPGPAGTRGQVGSFDLNVIPASAISRIDILKDGASSIYGSDAVAGVVNVITRSSIDGPELTVQANVPLEGGGESFAIDGAYAFDIGNGTILLSGAYELREDLSIGDRDYLGCSEDIIFDRTTGQRIDRQDRSITAGTEFEGCQGLYHNTIIDAVFGTRYVPRVDGSTSGPFAGYGPRRNESWTGASGQAFYEDVLYNELIASTDAINKQERISFYGVSNFTIPVGSGIDWDTEVLVTRRKTTAEGWRQFFPLIGGNTALIGSFRYDNSPGFVNPIGSGIAQPVAPYPSNADITVDYIYIASGLTGDFGTSGFLSKFGWSIDANFSRSDGEYVNNSIVASRSGDARFSETAPTYDPFSPGFLSGADLPNLIAQIGGTEVGTTVYEQTLLQGVITGELFELPAGSVGLALGVETRSFSIDDVPSENSQAGNLWGSSSAQVTKGEDTISEIFAEIEVPLIKGVPLFEQVTLNASARAFEYDTAGSGDVWKLGLNWQVNDAFRIRATKGTSFRGAALYELFLGNQTAFLSQLSIDPCIQWGDSSNTNIRANCAAEGIPSNYGGGASSATIISGGGAGFLQPETSEALTVGLIYTPSFIDLSIAVDYFEIAILDQVARLGAGAIIGGCYGGNNFPNAFCNSFTRNPASDPVAPLAITEVRDSFLNVNEQSTRGIDYTVRYEHEFDFGDVLVEANATQTLEDIVFLFDPNLTQGFDTSDFNGTIGDPEWVGSTRVQLTRGDWDFNWFMDYVGETSNEIFTASEFTYFGRAATRIVDTDAVYYHDLTVRWRGTDLTINGGVTNIFDEAPPIVSVNAATRRGNVPLTSQYDLRGRTAFVRFTKRF